MHQSAIIAHMTNHHDETYKTGYVAKWIGQHENTIRDWSARYESILSRGANSGRRRYTLGDVSILATIADYRQQGISLDDIGTLLQQGKLIETLPPEPTPDDLEARRQVNIVHVPETDYLLEVQSYEIKISALQSELESTKRDLETSEQDIETKQQRIIVLERDLSAAKAQLDIIKRERPSALFWLAVLFGAVLAVVLVVLGLTVYFTG